MTDKTLEIAQNAHAQAAATQSILMALLHGLRKRNQLPEELIIEAFDLAAETYTHGSYIREHPELSEHATRCLQVVDHMRSSLIGKDK